MRKFGLLLAAAAVAGLLTTGCGARQKSTFSPSASCVYVAQDGSVSSALVKEYEGEVDSRDLRQYLEAAVIRFNQENGAQGLAENKMGADNLPASLQSVSAEKGVMKAVFDYASSEYLIKFRQTDENEDTSNSITALEVKKTAGADTAGWLVDETFVKADKSTVTADEIKSDAEASVARIEGGGTVVFSGKIIYMTENAELKDEYTVTLPEDGSALIVFK